MGTLQEALVKKLRLKKDPETNEKMPQKGSKPEEKHEAGCKCAACK